MAAIVRRSLEGVKRRLLAWRGLPARLAEAERQIEVLRRENDQLRRDSLRIAELSDLVVERLSWDGEGR